MHQSLATQPGNHLLPRHTGAFVYLSQIPGLEIAAESSISLRGASSQRHADLLPQSLRLHQPELLSLVQLGIFSRSSSPPTDLMELLCASTVRGSFALLGGKRQDTLNTVSGGA